MRKVALAILFLFSSSLFAQSDVQNLVKTEKTFAALAAEKGTKHAFLEFTAPDGVLFLPDKIKATDYWNSRGESQGLLSWAPNYADISSSGILGYTSGNWEYRAKGKNDNTPSAYGEFVTIWQRQPNGEYKFIVDIGVEHERPEKYSTDVTFASTPGDGNEKNSSAADVASHFFELAVKKGRKTAYQTYAADDARMVREGKLPVTGKSKLLAAIKKVEGRIVFAKRSVFFQASDIAYITNTYTFTNKDKSVKKGNFLQIWKHMQGRWQIVLDIFKPVPEK